MRVIQPINIYTRRKENSHYDAAEVIDIAEDHVDTANSEYVASRLSHCWVSLIHRRKYVIGMRRFGALQEETKALQATVSRTNSRFRRIK